jgi:hypothetical protein
LFEGRILPLNRADDRNLLEKESLLDVENGSELWPDARKAEERENTAEAPRFRDDGMAEERENTRVDRKKLLVPNHIVNKPILRPQFPLGTAIV